MAETINMPKLGFDMAEGTLIRWLKKEGETVTKGEVLAEIETDKATVEVESTASGTVRKILVDEGTVVPVNTPIAVLGSPDEKIALPGGKTKSGPGSEKTKGKKQKPEVPDVKTAEPVHAALSEPAAESKAGSLRASPLAKRIAREKSVELGGIQGSGPGGRIVRRDVEAVLQSMSRGAQAAVVSSRVERPPSPADESIGLSRLRQAIARRMTEAKTTIPHFYVTHEFKMDALVELRSQFNKIVTENEKISVNDFIVKATALALRQFPNLNASLGDAAVLRHGKINIGVAVSVEGGLLTVVCQEADGKSLQQIAAEVRTMAARAREGKVRPEEIEGSTFSISNLGMYDVENFTAIINPPEAAILAVGSLREAAVVEEGVVKTGWRMKATLSVDHRVSDGAEAAKFMQALAVTLEEPLRLVI